MIQLTKWLGRLIKILSNMVKNETGKVVKLQFGFNCWGLETNHGEKFEPLNLPEDLMVDGLDVVFSGTRESGMASINMWGRPFIISEIKPVT
jgi:hypothetical protein